MSKKEPEGFKLIPSEQDRKTLIEGRNYGMGFGLAKEVGRELRLVMPISPCREYLNDQVVAEATGRTVGCYGLWGKPGGALTGDRLCMVTAICHYNRGPEYKGFAKDVKYMEEHLVDLVAFMSHFDDRFSKGLKRELVRTTAVKVEDNRWAFFFDKVWGSRTYLISLYSQSIRMGLEGRYGVLGDKDPDKFFATCDCTDSCYRGDPVPARMVSILDKGHLPENDISGRVHEYGIYQTDIELAA